MKKLALLLICIPMVWGLCVTLEVTAQDSGDRAEEESADEHGVGEYVARARRLREFGYPILAREQLDRGKAIDPSDKGLLLEYTRLFTRSDAGREETAPYVNTLLQLYPEDYESCLEVARWLFMTLPSPAPPSTASEEKLQFGLERLAGEMEVYRELAAYILQPDGEPPESAQGIPGLPLAFLARAEGDTAGTAVVADLAARDLDIRAIDFDRWSRTDEKLKEPFGTAAAELYELALPLYERAAKSDQFAASSRIAIANLLFRLGRYDEARKAIVEAELLAPRNVTTARTLLAIGEIEKDMQTVMQALKKLHAVYSDVYSQLDVFAAQRIIDNEWDFNWWRAWSELSSYSGRDRVAAVRALVREKPEFLEAYYVDALLALDFADIEKRPDERTALFRAALKMLDHCEEFGRDFHDWWRLRGECYWQLGEYEKAAEAYETLSGMDGGDTEARKHARAARDIVEGLYTARDYALYRQQLEYGDVKEKARVLKLIVERSPKFFSAQLLLGKVSAMLGDHETALSAYTAGHELEPGNLECMDGAARAAMRTDHFEDSLKYFSKLDEAEPDHGGSTRWKNLLKEVVEGDENRRKAFKSWLDSTSKHIEKTRRRKLLEEATLVDPDFPEALLELATIERESRPAAAEGYLKRALHNARDDYLRAAVHREWGRLELMRDRHGSAVQHFEEAYASHKQDGTDMLLAALTLHRMENEAEAAVRMRRLFAELPGTGLLRPKPADVNQLDLLPADAQGPLRLHPQYDIGDKLEFHVSLSVDGEGGGQPGREYAVEFDLHAEVVKAPNHSGVWGFRLSFRNAPPAYAALHRLELDLEISPWFGLIRETDVGAEMATVVNPAVQGLAEAFTVGLGDSPVPPPYVWKNDLTMGPPHFGGDAIEGACVSERIGERFTVVRRATAGRTIGDTRDEDTFSRILEAQVRLGGDRRAVLDVSFEIARKELTRERNDVVYSWLRCELSAR